MRKKSLVYSSWLLLLYSLGISYFLQGFLLTRREIHLKSTRSDGVSCCVEPKFKNIVMLVIDALRYDFILCDNHTSGEQLLKPSNCLPVVHNLLKDGHGVLYKFIADPPTTTMQRLKGLTTGSLPTFIDAGSNFASDELLEDNILRQMLSSNQKVTFMGDDTWMGLFPNSFNRFYPFPSFDVWDVDTVDRGVERHLIEEILKPDWNLIIAHCLGVDHTGHRYGPDHPAMPIKLKEMNSLIEKIIASMDSEALLLVMGDHGMTRTGDHGGDSPDEVTAGLFAFSPRWRVKLNNDTELRSVSQVDLVPTLSLLMGIPIPYSNLGTVILDLVIPEQLWKNSEPVDEEHRRLITSTYFADALNLNSKQVWRYLQTYNRDSTLPKKEFQELNSQFGHVSQLFDKLKLSNCFKNCSEEKKCCPEEKNLEEFINAAQVFLAQARAMCSSMWAQFDLDFMKIGLAIFVCSLCLHVAISFNYDSISMQSIGYYGLAGVTLSFAVRQWSTTSVLVLNIVPILFFFRCAAKHLHFQQLELFAVAPFIMAVSYTSNSFVVEEPYVVHHISQSLIWFPFLFERKTKKETILRACLSLSTRLALLFFRCREEQFPGCEAHNLYRSLNSLSASHWVVSARISLAFASCLGLYFLLKRHSKINRKIVYLFCLAWIYWIAQVFCFILGTCQEELTIYLPRLFYAGFVLQLFHSAYQWMYDGSLKNTSVYRGKILELVTLLSILACLLAGDGLTPGILLSFSSLLLFAEIYSQSDAKEMWPLYGVLSVHGFFSGGHHTSLANVPWETAFVGFSHSSSASGWANVLPVFLVSYSTAFSLLLHVIAVPFVALSSNPIKQSNKSRTRLITAWLYLLFFHAVRLFGCMVAAAIHRRHLMVWKIFAPRLLYELLFAVYTSIGTIISLILFQATV